MLRQLFISLIILSALTSEGAINFPANIYDLSLELIDARLMQENGGENTAKLQDGRSDGSPSFAAYSSGAFVLSDDCAGIFESGYHKTRLKDNGMYRGASSAVFVPIAAVLIFSFVKLSATFPACKDEKIITTCSDISPPVAAME